jgi:hypothetical protein
MTGHGGVPGPSPRPLQADIVVLEEDDYGRVLFSYDEGPSRGGSLMTNTNHVIMQKKDGNYVYFYPYYNFITSSEEGHRWEFTDEETEALKEANSWNQELSDESEFVRVRISRQKGEGSIAVERLGEVYSKVFPSSYTSRIRENMIFFRTDDYGRSIYLGVGIGEKRGTYIVVLFQPDHSFNFETGVHEIINLGSYQTELRLFMESNGWDTPHVIEMV